MVGKSFLRTEVGQRVDHPDMEHGTFYSQLRGLVQLGKDFVIGQSTGQSTDDHDAGYILAGFEASNPSGDQITVTKDQSNGVYGAAVLGTRHLGTVYQGLVLSQGEASRTRDLASAADGTYGVYIRLELRATTLLDRLFWDDVASPAEEFSRTIPTRWSENWGMTIELETAPPGAEWIQVAQVIVSGGNVTAVNDRRNFFFEGRAENAGVVTDNEWGDASDRLTDRANFGVFGVRRLARAVFRQLQDIIGGDGVATDTWFVDPQGGSPGSGPRSLRSLNEDKLDRSGTTTINGIILPDANGTRDFGATATRFATIYAAILNGTQVVSADFQASAADAYKFTSPAARSTYVSGHEFVADLSPDAWTASEVDYSGRTGFLVAAAIGNIQLTSNATNSAFSAVARISLPNSATITGMTLFGSTNSTSIEIGVARTPHNLNGTSPESLISAATGTNFPGLAITPVVSSTVPYTIPVDQNLMIQNELYKYLIMIRVTATSQTAIVHSIKIDFTTPHVTPA